MDRSWLEEHRSQLAKALAIRQAGMTQRQRGEVLGVHQSVISEIDSGKQRIPWALAVKIQTVYQEMRPLVIAYLLDEEKGVSSEAPDPTDNTTEAA